METDIQLIEKAKAGNSAAFSELLKSHYDFIYKVSFKFCANKEAAQNTAHEVCIALADKIFSFKGESQFQTWLYTIIMNTARDSFRREKVKRKYIQPGELPEDIIADNGLSETDKILAKQIYTIAISLPEKLKQAFLLVNMEDLSHAEAGKILKCSEGTISWRVHEAKKKIKELMEGKAAKVILKLIPLFTVIILWMIKK